MSTLRNVWVSLALVVLASCGDNHVGSSDVGPAEVVAVVGDSLVITDSDAILLLRHGAR